MNAATSNDELPRNPAGSSRIAFHVSEYDLAATLMSGQSFRWRLEHGAWTGVIGRRWVCLREAQSGIEAATTPAVDDWHWLRTYLQLDVDLPEIVSTFPNDEPMRAASTACRGLRLLRQDPWECLASFILSSTKQIVQIRQIVSGLCRRYGGPLPVLTGYAPRYSFPDPMRIAEASETDLRACKMGFRAPYLRATAQRVAARQVDLEALRGVDLDTARARLIELPGVGRKIADCVLLFAYGFPTAFPVDVWVIKAFRALYFRNRRVAPARLRRFSETHFGPYAGYAQQYLFHYMRTRSKQAARIKSSSLNR